MISDNLPSTIRNNWTVWTRATTEPWRWVIAGYMDESSAIHLMKQQPRFLVEAVVLPPGETPMEGRL